MPNSLNFDSYYHRTQIRSAIRDQLNTHLDTDICIIGGGLAGINTFLSLTERKIPTVLLEAKTLGHGASGRNGGFLSAGYSTHILALEKKYGRGYAKNLYRLSIDGVNIVRDRVHSYKEINSTTMPGILKMSWGPKPKPVKANIEYMNTVFGTHFTYWTRQKVQEFYSTNRYNDAVFNPNGFQLHALNYLLRCADKAEILGGKIFENTMATKLSKTRNGYKITTKNGLINASKVVVCISASPTNLNYKLFGSILPIGTYVLLTEPLNERLKDVIRAPFAVSDDRRVENYYRPLNTTQILWGGGISTRQNPAMLKKRMLNNLLRVYPQLTDIKAELAWPGTMGYARHGMPQIGRLDDALWYSQAFGGHGLNTTAIAGELIAKAISENDDTYRLFSPFQLKFTARPMGLAAAQLTYWSWIMRDLWDAR